MRVSRKPYTINQVVYKMHLFYLTRLFAVVGIPVLFFMLFFLLFPLSAILGCDNSETFWNVGMVVIFLLAIVGWRLILELTIYRMWKRQDYRELLWRCVKMERGLYEVCGENFLKEVEEDLQNGIRYVGPYLAISNKYIFGITPDSVEIRDYEPIVIPISHITMVSGDFIPHHDDSVFEDGFNFILDNGTTVVTAYGNRVRIDEQAGKLKRAGLKIQSFRKK